jgi:hypothetical protein
VSGHGLLATEYVPDGGLFAQRFIQTYIVNAGNTKDHIHTSFFQYPHNFIGSAAHFKSTPLSSIKRRKDSATY